MRRLKTSALLTCITLVGGCTQQAGVNNDARIDALDVQIAELQDAVSALRTQLQKVRNDAFIAKSTQSQYLTAAFDPAADSKYQRVDTSLGPFAVLVEDIKSYADGSSVILRIGNLTSASVGDCKLILKFGARAPTDTEADDYIERTDAWGKSLRTTTLELNEKLLPGTWNKVRTTLPGISPDHLGYIEVSMQTGSLWMTTQ